MTARQTRRVTPVAAAPPEAIHLEPAELQDDIPWQAFALCAETDPEAFFPERGQPSRTAKKVCGDCLVRAECLEFALAHDEQWGVWGGLSLRQRRQLKRQKRPRRTAPIKPRRRITVSDLGEIRARRAAGEKLAPLAEAYGTTHGYLSKLLNGRANPAPDPSDQTGPDRRTSNDMEAAA